MKDTSVTRTGLKVRGDLKAISKSRSSNNPRWFPKRNNKIPEFLIKGGERQDEGMEKHGSG